MAFDLTITKKRMRLFWFLLLCQSLIEPQMCQLSSQGAFFTVKRARMSNRLKKDGMILQTDFFRCGIDEGCSTIFTSAIKGKPEKGKVKNNNKKPMDQCGRQWMKIPRAGELSLISTGKNTKQSTDYGDALSSRAVDGNRANSFNDKSCACTQLEDTPWWRVDIGQRAMVYSVMITNRGDCCPERLSDFTIRVGFEDKKNVNPTCIENVGITTGITVDFKCHRALAGQFIYIESALSNTKLTLCEVEVYGCYF